MTTLSQIRERVLDYLEDYDHTTCEYVRNHVSDVELYSYVEIVAEGLRDDDSDECIFSCLQDQIYADIRISKAEHVCDDHLVWAVLNATYDNDDWVNEVIDAYEEFKERIYGQGVVE